MGNFYKNLTLVGPGQAEIVKALEAHQRVAYVSPSLNGVTVIFDLDADEIGDPAELGDLALTLSQALGCSALAAAVYDDDVLLLGLYDRGNQIGEYTSDGASNLSVSALMKAFGVQERIALWLLLRAPHLPLFLFESFRHRLLLRRLRAPPWAVATGYKYIQQGELPPELESSDLVHVGSARPWRARLRR